GDYRSTYAAGRVERSVCSARTWARGVNRRCPPPPRSASRRSRRIRPPGIRRASSAASFARTLRVASVSRNVFPRDERPRENEGCDCVANQSFPRRGFFEDALALLSLTRGLLRSTDRSTPRILNGSFVSGPGLARFFPSFELSPLT